MAFNESPPDAYRQARSKGGRNAQTPETWARNVARAWPSLDEERRQVVIEALRPLAQKPVGQVDDR